MTAILAICLWLTATALAGIGWTRLYARMPRCA